MRKLVISGRLSWLMLVAILVALVSCTTPTPTPPTPTPTLAPTPPLNTIPSGSIQVERVFPNLSFQEMTNLVQPDDTGGLIFITEQRGVIHAFAANQ
ncbi:MAG: hypothetical protein PHN78_09190, partial [Dehalococcoidales bacterium]|nr:hypothetical protein [Dehalococcoidales bacterium]